MNTVFARFDVRSACLLASVATLAISSAAFAQTAPVAAPQAADANVDAQQASGLSDIVVTARKRSESVQDVPIALTAVSGEQIQRADLTSIEKVAARIPAFTVGRASNGSGAQLTMRGIGSSSTSIGIEQSVATVVDGVYYGQGRIINEGFFDLARIEILKGPQALFFGKNATAGVVSITSADPGKDLEIIARARYEFNAKQPQIEVIASTPITDTLGIRVAVRASKMYGGLYRNEALPFTFTTTDVSNGVSTNHISQPSDRDAPGEKELLGRVTLKWEPTSDITNTLKASGDYSKTNNNSWNYVAFKCPTGNSALTGYACGNNFVTHQNKLPADIAASFPFAEKDGSLYNRYKSWQATNTLNVKLDDITLTNVTNYNWNNNRFTCACDFQSAGGSNWATENSTWHAFSNELRALTSYDGPLNFMVGGLYQRTKRTFEQYIIIGNVEDSTQSPANRYVGTSKSSFTKGETLSGFGQVIWKPLPKIEVTGGVRYTHETKDSFFAQPYNNVALTGIFRPANSPDGLGTITANQVFNDWSPDFTVTYKPQPGIMFYGAYKTNYKSGGFSNGGINSAFSADPNGDLTFAPEKARGFEIGAKTELFDRQLRFNIAAYTFKYTNLQVDFFNSPIFAFQTLSADARTKGIETDFEFAPRGLAGVNLHGSLNYNKARYIDFPLAPCYAGETPAQGCNLVPAVGGNFTRQNLTGAPLSVAPRWTGSLGVSYDRDLNDNLRYGIAVDARYSSSYLASAFGNPDSRQSRYVSLDASARIATADDRFEIALIGKNLTNRFYVTGNVDGPSTGGGTGTPAGIHADQLGFGNIPRTVQIQVSTRF